MEPVAEFGQIEGKMFLPHRAIGAMNGILDIARQGVAQRKAGFLTLDALGPADSFKNKKDLDKAPEDPKELFPRRLADCLW